jgi:cysteine synthase A
MVRILLVCSQTVQGIRYSLPVGRPRCCRHQKDDRGGDIRKVLRHRTGSPTIPQIFVGNRHIGGCTETFDAFNDGRLQQLLGESGIKVKARGNVDAYSFLPKWLQPR